MTDEKSEVLVDVSCPACNSKKMVLHAGILDLPYVGLCIQTTTICPACGYKVSDVTPIDEHEPVRIEFTVEKPEDLDVRVVKSSYAKVTLKELGVEIEPGPKSETYISNIEGLIRRFEDVLDNIKPTLKEDELKHYNEIKERIERILSGKEKLTIIIEDPKGISKVIKGDA